MKHSAKAIAKLAREREQQASQPNAGLVAGPAEAGESAGPAPAGAANRTAPAAHPATAITASGRPRARRLAQLPYAVVLAGIAAGLALMRGGIQEVRSGTLVVAGALLAGSLARLVLPDGRAGLLGSRRRLIDVAALTALGVGMLIAGLIVKTSS